MRFYDLKKPEPLCPKCGADQRESPVFEKPGRRSRKKATKKKATKKKATKKKVARRPKVDLTNAVDPDEAPPALEADQLDPSEAESIQVETD